MDKAYNIELACHSMKENVFEYLVVGILTQLEDRADEYLSIGFEPVREDTIGCIQAARNGDNFHVEIIQHRDEGEAYHIFAQDSVPLADTIAIFRAVCVDFLCVDMDNWEEISDTVKFYQEVRTFHEGQSFEEYKRNVSLYLQRQCDFTVEESEQRIQEYYDDIYESYLGKIPVRVIAYDLEDIEGTVQCPEYYI